MILSMQQIIESYCNDHESNNCTLKSCVLAQRRVKLGFWGLLYCNYNKEPPEPYSIKASTLNPKPERVPGVLPGSAPSTQKHPPQRWKVVVRLLKGLGVRGLRF